MKIYSIYDEEFRNYGLVLDGYSFEELFEKLRELPIPENEIVYEASVATLEECDVKEKMENRGFAAMPIQIGYVGGNNRFLNCLEYHKSSEFNIALDDVILVLGKQEQIVDGKFDTANCKAFLVPGGTGVELYATTLHYAPINLADSGYRVICVLPLGTNGKKPSIDIVNFEDKMMFGSNKWLLAHEESNECSQGAYCGLVGENINYYKFNF